MITIDDVEYTEENLSQDGVIRAKRINLLRERHVALILEAQETENSIMFHAQAIKAEMEGLNHNQPPIEAEALEAEADG